MKRSDVLTCLEQMVTYYPTSKVTPENFAKAILNTLEDYGMLPPEIRIFTPLGPNTFFDINKWEEDAEYDDEGFPRSGAV